MIGEVIAKKRTEMKLSQEQLAEKLCVSRSAIAKWETGKGVPILEFSEEKVAILAGKEFPAEDVVEVKVRCGWDEI